MTEEMEKVISVLGAEIIRLEENLESKARCIKDSEQRNESLWGTIKDLQDEVVKLQQKVVELTDFTIKNCPQPMRKAHKSDNA